MASRTKAQLLARMKEIEASLSSVQKDIHGIKARSMKLRKAAIEKGDKKKIEEIRKRIGL